MQVDVPDHLIGRGGVLSASLDEPTTAFHLTEPDDAWVLEVHRVELDGERTRWSYIGSHTLSRPLQHCSSPAMRRARAGVAAGKLRLAWATEALEALGIPQPVACHVVLERTKAGLP